ncbi:MAG: YitT family protein [Christensenellales bacterium]
MKEKKSFKKIFKLASTIFLAALFRAVGIQLFLLPNAITLGGAVGVASTLSWLFKDTLPDLMGAFLVVINIPLVIISYFKTGKKFALKTGICLLLMGGMMELLGLFDVASLVGTVGAGEDKVLFALIGGVLCGLSLPMMLSIQASTGGSDIVALLLQKTQARNKLHARHSLHRPGYHSGCRSCFAVFHQGRRL